MSWSTVSAWVVAGVVGASVVSSTEVFAFDDERITESSGLVDLGPLMVTTNDSGDAPRVYVVDSGSGRTVATTIYAGSVEDVEALAPDGKDSVWVGDIGDNQTRRKSVQVYRVPVGDRDQDVRAPEYELVYPDRAHDAESLIYGPDSRLRIITKSLFGGRVYVAPKNLDPDRPNRLVAGPAIDLWATDAALFPDGKHALIRGYGAAILTTFPGFKTVATVDLPDQDQGEAVSIARSGRIRLSSEGLRSDVLQISLPAEVLAQLRASPGPEPQDGLDSDGVLDSEDASGLNMGYLATLGAAAILGWLVLRRLRRSRSR